ncbi:MAG TPA: hypothetical protein PK431_10845 [Chitinophagales bacterium]|nr:hypothetical protein [Chitinophagales bacterium]
MKCLAFYLCIVFYNTCVSQIIDTNFVISDIEIINSLTSFYNKKDSAEKNFLKIEDRFKFLKFTPGIGYSVVQKSPVISVNTNDIFLALNFRQHKKAEKLKITAQNEILFNNDIITCLRLRSSIINKIFTYNQKYNLLEINTLLFEIIEKKYTNKEITPSDFFQEKLRFETLKINLLQDRENILALINDLAIKAKKADWVSLSISNY